MKKIVHVLLLFLLISCNVNRDLDLVAPNKTQISPLSILGLSIDSDEAKSYFDTFPNEFIANKDFPPDIYYYSYEDGIEITVTENIIQTIFLYNQGVQDYDKYNGVIIDDITIENNKEEIHSLLGEPDNQGGDEESIIGHIDEWEKYYLGDFTIHFSYSPEGKIQQVTLGTYQFESKFINDILPVLYISTEEINEILSVEYEELYSQDDSGEILGHFWVHQDSFVDIALHIIINVFPSEEETIFTTNNANKIFSDNGFEYSDFTSVLNAINPNPKYETTIFIKHNDICEEEYLINSYYSRYNVYILYCVDKAESFWTPQIEIDLIKILDEQWEKIINELGIN